MTMPGQFSVTINTPAFGAFEDGVLAVLAVRKGRVISCAPFELVIFDEEHATVELSKLPKP